MFRALYTASSGMDAQQRNIDVTANNIANVNTVGFKGARAEFEEMLYQQVRSGGSPQTGGAPTGVEVGLGVRTASTARTFSQGNLESTDNPLDLAIEGSGFFSGAAPKWRIRLHSLGRHAHGLFWPPGDPGWLGDPASDQHPRGCHQCVNQP